MWYKTDTDNLINLNLAYYIAFHKEITDLGNKWKILAYYEPGKNNSIIVREFNNEEEATICMNSIYSQLRISNQCGS